MHGGRLGAGTARVERANWRYEHEGERGGFSRDEGKRRKGGIRAAVGQGRLIGFREGDCFCLKSSKKEDYKRGKRFADKDSQDASMTKQEFFSNLSYSRPE